MTADTAWSTTKGTSISSVAVIGQGYVGREISLAAVASGHTVVGVDNDVEVVNSIKDYEATTKYASVADCDIVAICLPTPNDDHRLILGGIDRVIGYMKPGSLLIIESTVSVGFTAGIAEKCKSSKILVSYSPERIDPGNQNYTIKNTPKIVSGTTLKARELAARFYSSFCEEVVLADTTEAAEAAKLLENSFRLLNISFINEMSRYLYKIGLDSKTVIDLASSKPYGFMRFDPGIGAGGHCIPIDPAFLISSALKAGASIKTLETAMSINSGMASWFHAIAQDRLGGLSGKRICVVGISYKADIKDVRNSISLDLIKLLSASGAQVSWHDEVVKEHEGQKSSALTNEYDLAIIVNRHKVLDESLLVDKNILDCERL